MTSIQFWDVNSTVPADIPFNAGMISAHLLADWLPGLNPILADSFLGWPQFLTQSTRQGRVDFLSLNSSASGMERQWKGVISWMLGVSGARQFLAQEGYTWVAPLSAFYADNVQPVTIPANPPFPMTSLRASRNPTSKPKVQRPDYVAVRPAPGGGWNWAIVEAKGTKSCLKGGKYPSSWRDQANNAVLSWRGREFPVGRHVVVATRSNPDAVTESARRIQLRAWNSDLPYDAPPDEAAVEVAAANLFSVCLRLGLVSNATALAAAARARRIKASAQQVVARSLSALTAAADAELRDSGAEMTHAPDGWTDVRWGRQTPEITLKARISPTTVRLIRRLSASLNTASAVEAMQSVAPQLSSQPYRSEVHESGEASLWLPQGLTITAMPHGASKHASS